MFNAEKLLGKVLSEVMGSSHGKKSKKKKGKNSLVGNLTSGAGLMTAIGLGIGAYEILRDKKQPTAPGQVFRPQPTSPPPPLPGHVGTAPPPPPIPTATPPSVQRPAAPPAAINTEELATRMIQVMIAAAHADGTMDEQEEKAILDRLKGANLSQEEKMFLLDELHNPKSIAELTGGLSDPSAAKAMYMLAVGAIAIDTAEERKWLDELATGLGLSTAVQNFIEEQD